MILNTREEVFEAIDDMQWLDVMSWKWGTTDTYVFKRDGAYWRFTVNIHYDDGVQFDGPVECEEVREKVVSTIEWVKV